MIVGINDEVYIDTNEVVSVERKIVQKFVSTSLDGGYVAETFNGSRVILKNGRKIYVNGMMPKDLMKKLGLL